MAPRKIAPSAQELADRSEHQQGDHLDPKDRAHFWQHPASEHHPYDEKPAVGVFEPRWLHKRTEDGSIVDSVHVTHADAHAEALAAGFKS